jgi:hypothetical protein
MKIFFFLTCLANLKHSSGTPLDPSVDFAKTNTKNKTSHILVASKAQKGMNIESFSISKDLHISQHIHKNSK